MWYSKVVASLNSIPDFIQHYEQELEEARREVAVYGNIEKNLAGLPGITERRFNQLQEVEAVLKAHPDIFDAVVVGVPDERFGERVAAIVTTRNNTPVDLIEVQEFCSSSLARYKLPREIHLTEEIPRTAVGKPDYRWAKRIATG